MNGATVKGKLNGKVSRMNVKSTVTDAEGALQVLRESIRSLTLATDADRVPKLAEMADLSTADRASIHSSASTLVSKIRKSSKPGLMEVFLAEYGLSSEEGVALMCLAEALLRVPDADTMDALIEDKIAPSDWSKHQRQSASMLVNASTWGLMLTGKVLSEDRPGVAGVLSGMVKRLGEPVIRTAVARAMKEMGRQFVLGETITSAMVRAKTREGEGYTYSYDMLGEAARTEDDAQAYLTAYREAIVAAGTSPIGGDIRERPGVSVKLSALFPRYEFPQKARVMEVLVPRLIELARLAAEVKIGLNIDAEEADRLDLSLDVIEAALSDPSLVGWDGFGVVVQAYGPRAPAVIDWLYALAVRLDRRIMVRLVKGAYWDTEIKRSQVMGLDGFPVFTQKPVTDISYISNSRKLLGMTDRIYPQFATHNAHTVAAILHMAGDPNTFEFQRLHGMGERLHDIVKSERETRCRIYAPVGAHRDLLAYLVRRLLENGANSSFVNQIVDESVPPSEVASDPFEMVGDSMIPRPAEIFPGRANSQGFDWTDPVDMAQIDVARGQFPNLPDAPGASDVADVLAAFDAAKPWSVPSKSRSEILRKAADLYEANYGEIFACLALEAGKTMMDCVGELREAVDFLRYYADEAETLNATPRGTFVCISPWNFPLAIFTGQIAAALATGNAVLAKPAEQTPRIAQIAVRLLFEAGVPSDALSLLIGGAPIGAALTSDPRVDGVCFTGSTATAQSIHRSLATGNPTAPLIAETGGLNAMIVDSTALPEQAVRDIAASAFQSAGQRCSALRCLYVQEDIADTLTDMLKGAMDELATGNPWHLATDVGPIIDAPAAAKINAHIASSDVVHQNAAPAGNFVPPTLIRVQGIEAMAEEIFGPVLHIATFKSHELDKVITDINATGYGLTFGLHSRIDDRVQHVIDRVHAGNIYVNRNQIGAVVGSQPFGGEGLSGTGPKAGGPFYLTRFTTDAIPKTQTPRDMPGPTGETNRLTLIPRDTFLCCGPDTQAQIAQVEAAGGTARAHDPKNPIPDAPISGVLWSGDQATAKLIRTQLAARIGAITPLLTNAPTQADCLAERHVCIDTTASGGNAQLLMESSA